MAKKNLSTSLKLNLKLLRPQNSITSLFMGKEAPPKRRLRAVSAPYIPWLMPSKCFPKKMDEKPSGYFDFTVYPLEGVWDINNKAKESYSGEIKKEDFVYKLMIRQPDFVKLPLFKEILNYVKNKKTNPLLNQVNFETISEEKCVQMLHLGRFEDEPISFEKMEAFTKDQGLNRLSKVHKEISLSDTRKVVPEKLKTVLRFRVG
ncbi:hypothetical protein ACJJIE_08290 [Microbulbifer sp. TRSA001]|uniref:hypothetical protein n=1 Tax=Microbulbifer sp. TRSA001 TaxID=3243381 RepID=UPI00403A1678